MEQISSTCRLLPCQIRDRLQRCGRKHELGKDSRIYKKMPLSIAAEKHVIFKCTLYVPSLTFILSAQFNSIKCIHIVVQEISELFHLQTWNSMPIKQY